MNHQPADGTAEVEFTVTYLEMCARPSDVNLATPRHDVSIVRSMRPTTSFYRFLYNAVGGRWNWLDRNLLSDDQLLEIIQDESLELHVLYVAGTPAGFSELDRHSPGDFELKYFGLIPEFIGQGLGRYLLDWTIDRAWSTGCKRFWLHTCTLDHPRALTNYLAAGFTEFRTEVKRRKVPVYEL